MAITLSVESPLQDDVRALIAELNEVLLALTPPEFCFHMTADEMARPDTTVFVAREEGRAVACGALRRHGEGIGEVKRMYTRPAHAGRGIGGRILFEIEALARAEGLSRLVLETGHRHPAAWRVYERGGFTRCGVVLDYPDNPYSVFYEKSLARNGPHIISSSLVGEGQGGGESRTSVGAPPTPRIKSGAGSNPSPQAFGSSEGRSDVGRARGQGGGESARRGGQGGDSRP
jgi:putative acetyltransferase